MKVKFKAIYLFFGLIILFNCAKMNEPISVGGSLNIEHRFEVSGYARDISVTDSYLYIAEDQAGYTIYDLNTNKMISHHESFIMETDPIMFENVRAISVFEDENLLFVYDQYGSPASVFGFDMTDKTNPTYLFYNSGNTGSIVQLESDVSLGGGVDLYWTSGVFFNFSSSDNSWVGSNAFAFQNSVKGFDIDASNIYLAAEQLGFHIVNKSNGDIISTTDTDGEALNIKIVDHYMVVALRQAGFAVYDISSASNPNFVCQKETNEYIYTIDIENENMVLGSHSGGVYLYEISDITNPVLVGNLNSDKIGYTYKAVLHNNKIYASTRQGVYEIGID
ncbi:MAG: hypothetical protein P9M11_09365 [Candidatus Tenebribacter burtonii]|nr:hypothetical protein [Candidatus Tenebribacter burtonii]